MKVSIKENKKIKAKMIEEGEKSIDYTELLESFKEDDANCDNSLPTTITEEILLKVTPKNFVIPAKGGLRVEVECLSGVELLVLVIVRSYIFKISSPMREYKAQTHIYEKMKKGRVLHFNIVLRDRKEAVLSPEVGYSQECKTPQGCLIIEHCEPGKGDLPFFSYMKTRKRRKPTLSRLITGGGYNCGYKKWELSVEKPTKEYKEMKAKWEKILEEREKSKEKRLENKAKGEDKNEQKELKSKDLKIFSATDEKGKSKHETNPESKSDPSEFLLEMSPDRLIENTENSSIVIRIKNPTEFVQLVIVDKESFIYIFDYAANLTFLKRENEEMERDLRQKAYQLIYPNDVIILEFVYRDAEDLDNQDKYTNPHAEGYLRISHLSMGKPPVSKPRESELKRMLRNRELKWSVLEKKFEINNETWQLKNLKFLSNCSKLPAEKEVKKTEKQYDRKKMEREAAEKKRREEEIRRNKQEQQFEKSLKETEKELEKRRIMMEKAEFQKGYESYVEFLENKKQGNLELTTLDETTTIENVHYRNKRKQKCTIF